MGGCAGCCAGGGGGFERVGIVAGYQVFLSENQIQVSNLCAWILVPFEMKGRTLKKGNNYLDSTKARAENGGAA
jgi:hypothetical protein